ncbi:MAG: trigger factor [Bacteroidota bacterium]
MNITLQDKAELNKIIKIEIVPSDYQEQVEKVLREHQKKESIHGFRPGKVPFELLKKKYGRAVKADEVIRLIDTSLTSYLEDNHIEYLFQPMTYHENDSEIDFDQQDSFEFMFEIGIKPQFEIELNKSIEVEYPEIIVEEDVVERYCEDIQRHNGHFHTHEQASKGDVILGELYELNEDGEALVDGIKNEAYLITNYLTDEGLKVFVGAMSGDEVLFNPANCFKTKEQIATFLKIDKEKAKTISSDFMLKVSEIKFLHAAELNEELYEKVFPGEGIANVDDFKVRLSKNISYNYANECEQLFNFNVQRKLIEITNLPVPAEFIKRYLLESKDFNFTAEELGKDFSHYLTSFRWQLIENKLNKQYKIEVTEEEVRDFVKFNYIMPYFAHQQWAPEMGEFLDKLTDDYMKKKDEIKNVYEKIFEQKLIDEIRNNITLIAKAYTYDEFNALIATNKMDYGK